MVSLKALLAVLALLGAPLDTRTVVADAIARNARTPEEAAFLVAWARHESEFQLRIANNQCKPWECDRGRARGLWQSHERAAGTAWAHLPGNIDLQAFVAVRHVRWALRECKTPLGAFRRLGGLGCDRPLKGEAARMASFEKARRALP